jgi:RNA-binding protein
MIKLTGKQVRFLKGLGHHLNPVVMIGKGDIGPTLIASLQEALSSHELIKVKIQEGCLLDRKEVAAIISEKADAAVVQILGRTILLYSPAEEKKIKLP